MALHELAAACLSASSVWLGTRRSPWCFPVGLVSISTYIWVYLGARLYSEVLLQIIWVGMLLLGWYRWRQNLDRTGHARVASLQPRYALAHLGLGISCGLALGYVMAQHTNASLPWLDAMLTTLSLVAQFWQNRRHIAAWWMWIAVDVLYIGMFINKELYVTAVLYTGFIGLAIKGWRDWSKAAAQARSEQISADVSELQQQK
jgi:nicotinamide mononucleotide transporter